MMHGVANDERASRRLPGLRLTIAGVGALGLTVAEFLPLLEVRANGRVVSTVRTGSHHSYAQLLIALTAALVVVAAIVSARQMTLLALAPLGIAALVIALVGDLPDARASGLLPGFRNAQAAPRSGLWLELAAGFLLLVDSVAVLLLRTRDT